MFSLFWCYLLLDPRSGMDKNQEFNRSLANAILSVVLQKCSEKYAMAREKVELNPLWSWHNVAHRQGFGSGSAWIRINFSCRIRILIQIADPDPGGQNDPQK
jgi:hypothetical protein